MVRLLASTIAHYSILQIDGKYSERVQIPAKAIAEFFDRYFHIPRNETRT